jgi:hypothetical protein
MSKEFWSLLSILDLYEKLWLKKLKENACKK